MSRLLAAGALLSLSACGAGSTSDAPPAAPTWQEVRPLVSTHCAACHDDGGIAPFALTTAEGIVEHGAAVAESVRARRMPPWGVTVDAGCGEWDAPRWLPEEDVERIARFALHGDGGEPGPAEPPTLDRARADITLDPGDSYVPDGRLTDDYRCFLVDPDLTEDTFLTAYEVLPGEPRVVHHVILFSLTSDAADGVAQELDDNDPGLGYTCFGGAIAPSSAIGGWAPGGGATRHPAGTGVRLTAGRRLVMQVHYNLRQGALPDRTLVALETEPSVESQGLIFGVADTTLEVPAGQPAHETVREFDLTGFGLPLGMNLRGAFPHMHELGVSMRVEAVRGDVVRCLFDVPRWDFQWQQFYFYREPIYVYPDETLRLSCTYDTTSRTAPVRWGEGTEDEMCLAGFYVTPF